MLIIYVNRNSFSVKYVQTATTGVVNKYEHTALFAMNAWFNSRPEHRGVKLTGGWYRIKNRYWSKS